MIPKRRGRPRKNADLSLIDWTEPERNAHVLDWRQRAHEFGLQPGDETDEAPVLPSDTLLQEDDPEAYEPHDFRAIDESGRTKDELGDEDEDEEMSRKPMTGRPRRRARARISTSCGST